jgi:hypothetical protein
VAATKLIWVGLAIMIVSETATIAQIEPFWSWNTPIAWTGFILFADGIVWRARVDSWLRSAPRESSLLALMSIALWVMFEGFNLRIRNWHYVGLPENPALRYFGYAWSFATIWPAIFVGAELVAVARERSGGSRRSGGSVSRATTGSRRHGAEPSLPAPPALPAPLAGAALASVAAGALMLAAPFLVSRELARYMAAPVWLGFIFLLDPINARLGAESLWADWRAGRRDRLINLVLSGFLCGVLWEFWNYWSRAKWIYTVPIMERLKIFEMPLPGYFGFPAFALECFTLYVFLRRLVTRGGRRVGL